jgi:hypothetical protein
MINWENLYFKLIQERIVQKGEKHHIIPKHDGGKNSDGLVVLSHRNHILAHYIRWRWKKQIGDMWAVRMMSGSKINPMHNIEFREMILRINEEMNQNPDFIERKRKQAIERWNDPIQRKKYLDSRKNYINNLEDKSIVAKHLHTEEHKKAGVERLKNWVNNNPEKYKESLKKSKQIRLEKIKKLSKKELKDRFGFPGDKNGNWESYYIIIKDNVEIKYESQAHLLKETKISRIAVNKYKDTDKIIPRGKLKGYKIKTTKLK